MPKSYQAHPKYVHAYRDRHGKKRWYLRRPGKPLVRLPDEPWTPEFMLAYHEALAAKEPPEGSSKRQPGVIVLGSIDQLVVAYLKSSDYTELGPLTQKARRFLIERLREKFGDRSIAKLTPEVASHLLSPFSGHVQKNWLKMFRGLFKYGIQTGLCAADPTAGFKCKKAAKSDGLYQWTAADIERFRARHVLGTTARLAMELMLNTATAACDAVKLGPQHVKNGLITYRRSKTSVPVDGVPMLPELAQAIAAAPSHQLTFMVGDSGRPFEAQRLSRMFRQWCDEAGLPQCTSHGLRKALATQIADAGGDVFEIQAALGQRTSQMAEYYARGHNRKLAVGRAFEKLTRARGTLPR